MKKWALSLALTMLTCFCVQSNAASLSQDITGTYAGRVISVVMNGDAVSKSRFEGKTFTFSVLREKDGYSLAGHLEFNGGPAHHVISLPATRVLFSLAPDGQIVRGRGKGHISIKVFRFVSALNKDFNITSIRGKVVDGQLTFTIQVVIPDYKDGYTTSFSFMGRKQ